MMVLYSSLLQLHILCNSRTSDNQMQSYYCYLDNQTLNTYMAFGLSMTSQPLFQNTFILRRPGVSIFAAIVKIVIIFVRKPLQAQIKLK